MAPTVASADHEPLTRDNGYLTCTLRRSEDLRAPTYNLEAMLTQRQELVLRRLVEDYLDAGAPVGSKALSAAFEWGPSTIRHELANLEELGLLAHPHTCAGRVPTEAGYRYFVDRLLPDTPSGPCAVARALVRRELDEAMRVTTETLSQVTNLLAIVTAPPIETSTIRHVEVLALQPQVLMVVVITSTGGVTKRLFTFPRPVDTGLVDWAASYLNERLVGLGLGARILHQRLHDPGCRPPRRPSWTRSRRCSPSWRSPPGDPVRRRHRQAADHGPGGRRLRAQPAHGDARAPRRRCSSILRSALSAGHSVASGSAPRTRCPRCAPWPSWRPATACRSGRWARCR